MNHNPSNEYERMQRQGLIGKPTMPPNVQSAECCYNCHWAGVEVSKPNGINCKKYGGIVVRTHICDSFRKYEGSQVR